MRDTGVDAITIKGLSKLLPYIVMVQLLPKVALAPLIVIWFGLGLSSKVINAALVAFFPLLVNTMVGLRSADEDRISLMRSLAASEGQIFWMLRLPNALPFVMAGRDIAMIFALIGAIVAQFVGATSGLGLLIQSMNYRDYAEFLLKWGAIKQEVEAADLITNELIGAINQLDVAKVAAEAEAYTYLR